MMCLYFLRYINGIIYSFEVTVIYLMVSVSSKKYALMIVIIVQLVINYINTSTIQYNPFK